MQTDKVPTKNTISSANRESAKNKTTWIISRKAAWFIFLKNGITKTTYEDNKNNFFVIFKAG